MRVEQAERQRHALPKLVGCRVGDGERAACRKGSGCPTLPGPRNEPIMSWGLGMGPAPKGSNAEGDKRTHHCYCLTLENYIVVSFYFLHSIKCHFKLGISPGGAGEGHGEAVFGTTLCGVDWADDGPLVGWGGAPNKSPRRSVAAAAADGGRGEGHGRLIASPSRPRRSTSSAGAWAAGIGAGGSGFWGAVLALLRWLERESISSSEGSLSSPWPRPSGPPWGLGLGSAGG